MGGMGILYLMMSGFVAALTEGEPLPGAANILILVIFFLILSFVTHLQQYRATYGLVYREVRNVRLGLAERLRKLPLGYFGKRDLADLTETIMGDVNRLEHVWSHCLGYLYGSYISTAIIAVMLLVYNWKLALACLWGGSRCLLAAVRQPDTGAPQLRDDQAGGDSGLRRHSGDTGEHP
jgi:ATP-binding cassette subfamily B protein